MSDLLPPDYFSAALANSARMGDPLQFYLQEEVILAYYRNRIPELNPSTVFNGFDKWYKRRKTFKQIEEMLEQHHVNLIAVVLQGQLITQGWKATYMQRELQWTEELRRAGEMNAVQLNYQAQLRQMDEEAQRRRDIRLHEHAMELQRLNNDHGLALKNAGIISPVQRVSDMQQVSDKLREMLIDIHNSDYPERVKNQWAGMIIRIGQSSLT